MLGASALLAATVSAGSAGADPEPTPAPGPPPGPVAEDTAAQDTAAAPENTDGPKTVIDSDGTFRVGADIVPGTYASQGPRDGVACYWKRIGGPNGDEILDNALTKKPQVVRIEATDLSFKTNECQTWTLTDQQPQQPGAGGLLIGLADITARLGSAPKPGN
ncbi:hypothetical protein H7I02_08425 [Mycolicibacterium brumae]|uniref:Lipoprotein n=2 Tax=Mycolicibacterium brumae TaxID=85968 RepID=A0A2G5PEZ8_9MYCO|nr:hypothetical protein [Mycolicibacterium brumae]PIB76514.1 hypothetical protein CQY22_005170 [Mycolicibacterium brumae]RWA23403.1 hypothetical protein MBRU_00870 [Mycolicibacterium brumae DSM 44177]